MNIAKQAYAVRWKNCSQWDIKTAKATLFRLAHPSFRPMSDFAEEVTEIVRPMEAPDHEWPVYGVNNTTGVFLSHHQKGDRFNAPYKRIQKDWFFHNPTRANVGSLGRVPDVPDDAITSPEYQVWRVRGGLLPDFVEILIKTQFFINLIDCHRVGAVKERLYVGNLLEIPVPDVSVDQQRAVVSLWKRATADMENIQNRISALVEQIEMDFLSALGLRRPKRTTLPKIFGIGWKDLDRWSVMFNQQASISVDITAGKYTSVPLRECIDHTINGYCIRPVNRETPYRMLKLSALKPDGLDLTESKFVKISNRIAERFHIARGDLLVCRSVGSFSHVAKCAIVEEDHPDILFPDIIIRVRFNDRILSAYAREVIQSSVGRAWFQQNARTAVGMWKIGGTDIGKFPMPLPTIVEQQRLIAQVTAQRHVISELKAEVEKKSKRAKKDVEAMILGIKPVPAQSKPGKHHEHL